MRTRTNHGRTGLHFACFTFVVAISLSWLVTDLLAQQSLPIVRETAAVRAHIYIASADIAEHAKQIAETTWETGSKLYGAELPNEPLNATLYRDIEGYKKADKRLTGGKFARNQAFAHFDTLSAHVALQPPIDDSVLEKVGLPKLSAELFAHEIAHLIRFHHMPNSFRNHPRWLIDGAATLIGQEVMQELGYIDEVKLDPEFGADANRVKRLLKANKLPRVETLLNDSKLEIEFYERYSTNWALVDMLATHHGDGFSAFMKDLKRLGGGSGYADRAKELLLKHLSVTIDQLESDFRAHVEGLKPIWVDQIRALETAGATWHQLAFPGSNATSWRQEEIPDSFVILATARILQAEGRQLNLRVGRSNSFTQFSLTAEFGLNVFSFDQGKWMTDGQQKIDGLVIDLPIALELKYERAEQMLVLMVNDEEVWRVTKALPPEIQMGIGAQKGSAIEWKNLRIERSR